jgi:uncharacterized lipoprotein YajG
MLGYHADTIENDSVSSAMKRSASKTLISVLVLTAALAVAGCATHQETTQTTYTTTPGYTDDSPPQTTTTTTTTSDEPDSVVGSVFHAVGTVILFPFRLIGDAVGLLV